jgi:hypothetical protein
VWAYTKEVIRGLQRILAFKPFPFTLLRGRRIKTRRDCWVPECQQRNFKGKLLHEVEKIKNKWQYLKRGI